MVVSSCPEYLAGNDSAHVRARMLSGEGYFLYSNIAIGVTGRDKMVYDFVLDGLGRTGRGDITTGSADGGGTKTGTVVGGCRGKWNSNA